MLGRRIGDSDANHIIEVFREINIGRLILGFGRLDIKNAVKSYIHNLPLLVSSEQEPAIVILLDMIRTERPLSFGLIKRLVIHFYLLPADNEIK